MIVKDKRLGSLGEGVCHRRGIAWGRIGLGRVGLWLTIVGWRQLLFREVVVSHVH